MLKRFLGLALLIVIALSVTTAAYLYAKGYRIDFKNRSIDGTGIIQITTTPKGAAVLIDGEKSPKQATDVNLTNLHPGKYKITLKKSGFIDWQKEVEVRAGLVTPLEALLFPAAPNLKAVTFTGVLGPKISPDNQKLVYAVNSADKEGLWVLDLSDRPLFFSKEPKLIAQDSSTFKFSSAEYQWIPDSKSVLVTLKVAEVEKNFLLDASSENKQFTDISAKVSELKKGWLQDSTLKTSDRFNHIGSQAKKLSEGAKTVSFSPDEERVLIVKKDGTALVYDSKPYVGFDDKAKIYNLPKADSYLWYPEETQSGHDSHHLILISKASISLIESDGSNQATIYTGNFDLEAVFAWPNGSKLIISTSLNSSIAKQPNLYSIDLH
ncbi:MAG: PEGA domain-containing protein [bacterium]|nr:PEGA domain-containing protein [bacterium]